MIQRSSIRLPWPTRKTNVLKDEKKYLIQAEQRDAPVFSHVFFSFANLDDRREKNTIIERRQRRDQSVVKSYSLRFHTHTHTKVSFMAGVAKVLGGHIINKSHKEVDLNGKRYSGRIFGLYFSAHWYVSFLLVFSVEFY